ncbi:MAG TPA: hypothetical protein PLB41_02540 [Rubrivivax sp.]|nr:hypothetical protein [Rubrivivax sp.]HPO19365.1 hypothetical protein [Rubrivivax sp.]
MTCKVIGAGMTCKVIDATTTCKVIGAGMTCKVIDRRAAAPHTAAIAHPLRKPTRSRK